MKTLLIALVLSAQAGAVAYRRETSLPLRRCDPSASAGRFPFTTAYLRRILAALTTAHPDTFRGDLAPDLLCVGVSDNLVGLRAFADIESRSFDIEPGLIRLAENDAQLAFVMAHELAHITMRNTLCDGLPAELQGRDELVVRKCEVDRLVEERNASKGILSDLEMAALSARIESLETLVWSALRSQMGNERVVNWIEVEADEVGRLLYLGAGFRESEFSWRHEQIVLFPSTTIPTRPLAAADRRTQALAACHLSPGAPSPVRGTNRYADMCWSLWNFFVNQPVPGAGDGLNLEGAPTLGEVKAELDAQEALEVLRKPTS